MAERKIGKVISIDSFRVVIQLDSDLKSLYKSGFSDIYEIARINSYVIIPVGADRIVALVTRVKVQDETEIEKRSGSITLPKAERYLIATMLGTIEKKGEKSKYIQGVYNYPILDNPVWYVLNEDLDAIFDSKEKQEIDYSKDFYLPIGSSPAFTEYDIRICPDQLFAKHAAVLGNTGSGKSCTVATLLQTLFRHEFPNDKKLKSAHFIIFDTNGEYKRAFIEEDGSYIDFKEQVNTFYISSEDVKVPYWFMNYDDLDYLFQPSSLTQAPVLKRAVGLAKEDDESEKSGLISRYLQSGIEAIINSEFDEIKKRRCWNDFGNWKHQPDNEILNLSASLEKIDSDIVGQIVNQLKIIGSDTSITDTNEAIEQLRVNFQVYLNSIEEDRVEVNRNIDLPKWFSYEKLITKFIEEAIKETEGSKDRLRENVSTLKLRLQSYLSDTRIADPLLFDYNKDNLDDDSLLTKFLMFILGEFFQIPKDQYEDLFSGIYSDSEVNSEKRSQVTIVDLSLLPFEVLETITGLLGRLIMDFVSRLESRGSFPTVLVLEEAQNYIPEKDRTDRVSISKKVFERVAREGRKFGVSLIVSSQRPSELSKTVLSQCNSFIIHRLQNPDDQKYVRQLVSSANEDILQQLPILPQQQAIVMGDAVRTPVQTLIKNAYPIPDSKNPKFVEKWFNETGLDYEGFKKLTKKWVKGES